MPTLWDVLTKNNLFYNPLEIKVGDTIKIAGYENFKLFEIRIVDRKINKFIDYDIVANSLKFRLRLTPVEENDENLTHDVLLLKHIDEFPYNKEFHENLKFINNKGEFYEQKWDANYSRINAIEKEWSATIFDIENKAKGEMKYWDFWRRTLDNQEEFYIVEMNDSIFSIWVGNNANLTKIEINK